MSIQTIFSTKNRKFAGWLFAVISTFFIVAAKYQTASLHVKPATKSVYKAVIFDLGDVLLTTSSSAKTNVILPTIVKNPSLLYYLIGFQVKEEFFKLLHTIPAKTTQSMFNQSKRMPQIMVDWQVGATSCKQLLNTVKQHVKQSNHPKSIKKLFISVAKLMFDPERLANSQTVIMPMMHLAKKFKSAGYKLYVLSNWEQDSFELVKKQNPDLFKLFDGIVISGKEKIGKPCEEFYNILLERYNLNCSECIFIDDEINNIKAARKLGITGIVCDKHTSVVKSLIKHGVLVLKS